MTLPSRPVPSSGAEAQPIKSHGTSGFAQILVLIGLVTLSAIVTAVLATSTLGSKSTAALERLIQADALGRSAFLRLEASLADPSDDLAARALGGAAPASIDVAGITITLAIDSQAGKIDVMRADTQLLDKYLGNAGVTSSERSRSIETLNSARARNDSRAALSAITDGLIGRLSFDQVAADLTRYGMHDGIDPTHATARVLAAIPDLSLGQAAQLAAAPQSAGSLGIASAYFSSDSRHFEVVALIHWSSTETSTIRVPMELTASGRLVALAGPSWRAPA